MPGPNTTTARAGEPAPIPHSAWSAARRGILEAFAAGERLVLLVGGPGSGKTLLLREIEASLRSPSFRVGRVEGSGWAEGAPLSQILLVDDAERIGDAELRQVAERAVGFTVLAGTPALARRLGALPHRLVELGPIQERDIPAYVAAQVIRAGLENDRLGGGTVEAFASAAKGDPARLNRLIGTSFLVANMAGSREVLPEHVRRAAAVRTGRPSKPRAAGQSSSVIDEAETSPFLTPAPSEGAGFDLRRGLLLASVPLALLVAAGAWFLWPEAETPRQREAPAVLAQRPTAPEAPAPAPPLAREEEPRPAEPAAPAPPPPVPEPPRAAAPVPEPPAPVAAAPAPEPPFLPDPGTTAAPANPTGLERPADPVEPPARGAPPAGAMVRVVITYPRAAPGAAQRAAALSSELDRAGLSAGMPFPLSRSTAGPELNYFFREDREAALRVAQAGAGQIGEAVPRLAPLGGALPRPGTIEVGLPGPGAAPGDRATPPEPPAAPAPEPAVPSSPPEATVLGADAAQRGVTLSWGVPARADSFVEVLILEGGEAPPREVFAGYSEAQGTQTIRLSRPGLYAWRVLAVSRSARRYAPSRWYYFTVAEASQ